MVQLGGGTYSWSKVTSGLKNYYVSQQNYEGDFGVADVLSPTGSGTDRFYVMALENFGKTSANPKGKYSWYYKASGKMNTTVTSTDFGTGRANTTAMISEWNNSNYGTQEDDDIWGVIQSEVTKGWFVPSRGELAAYANEMNLGLDYYDKYSLTDHWSSSQGSTWSAWSCNFSFSRMEYTVAVGGYNSVRLSTTF